ncbi:MAG: hypothetical protein KKH11_03750 [Candidatus Omnitrophica bacterium]|nr:hypothetical protein [Candidatus Omnitrophota bacterium]
MKTKPLWTILLLSFALCGCAGGPHIIGYDIIKSPLPPPSLGKVYILTFADERPKEERRGVKGKLLAFSSRDAHFSKKVPQAIEEALKGELNNAGFSVVEDKDSCDYRLAGAVKHFQAIASPAKITFLPYLGSLSTLWAKDDFTIALSIYVKMTHPGGRVLIDKAFDVSQDMRLPTGLLNLARYSRGFNYKLKLLDEALKDVMGQIRDEAKATVKK